MSERASTTHRALTRDAVDPKTFTLQQVMLRVVDPKPAVDFFTTHFGMTVIEIKKFPEYTFDLYFLASLPSDHPPTPAPGTPEASKFLWSFPRCTIELTHNYGTESKKDEKVYWNGNEAPYEGFSHLGFIVDNVHDFCSKLESNRVAFEKRPTEGAALAIAREPSTNYWMSVLPRSTTFPATAVSGKPSLQHIMLRIKDPKATIPFYETHFGMTTVCIRHFPEQKVSHYYGGVFPKGTKLPEDPNSEEAFEFACATSYTLLAFTHKHGTESDPEFKGYCNGNVDPGRGFGHIGFLTDSLEATCEQLEKDGVSFKKRPHEGKMRGLAFALDPDGYWIEIIRRGLE